MIWNVCYTIAIVEICLALALFIRQYNRKKDTFSSAVKTLIIGYAMSLFTLLLPIQLDNFGTDAVGVTKAVLMSLNRTLRSFVLTDINFMPSTASIGSGLFPAYSVTLMALCFVCPFLTIGYILSFFSKFRTGVRLVWCRSRNLCVFSQLNDHSLALAKDLSLNHPAWRMIFCDVNAPVKGNNGNLTDEAEKLGALCLTKDITTMTFRYHSRKRSVWFFTISSNEQLNTNDALELLAEYRMREHTRIYLFSTLTESHMILSGADPGKVKLRRIDISHCLINRFLYNNGDQLFYGAADEEGGVKTISAVIVGLGHYGKEMLKSLAWFCQMDGYRLVIDAFDKSSAPARELEAECGDLLDPRYNGVEAAGEAAYEIRLHTGVEVRSGEFCSMLRSLPHPTFAFVSLGNDSDNIEISAMLRTLFERSGVRPDLYTIIRSSDKKRMLENIENFKRQKYDIHSIGDIPSTFSEKEIISSELEQEALRLHKQWGDEADFWRYEYNYQSSTARAIHLKARSNLSGQAASRSGITEHKRWNAYMRSLGYTYSGSGDPSSRNDLAKLHNDLIPYDQLSASEKLKDEDP